jgi:hypothetical protein
MEFKIPTNVRKAAERAYRLRDDYGYKGATSTGWARAKQLSTKTYIPIETLRTMRNWYARHYYTSKPGYDAWVKTGDKKHQRAVIAWLTWGGTPGLNWVNSIRVINKLNSYYDKDYDKIY